MSDYGFKTLDKSNATVINAKYPIFGFDMAHLPRAYKTFSIKDNSTNPFVSGSVSVPSITATQTYAWSYKDSSDYGSVRELIKKVEHGYSFRPLGYATISGTLRMTKSISVQQDEVTVSATFGSFGGDYSSTTDHAVQFGTGTTGHLIPLYKGGFFVGEVPTANTYFAPQYRLDTSDYSGTIFHDDILFWLKYYLTNISTPNIMLECPPDFIEVEIDDKYIYIYRKYWWSDTIRRVVQANSPITSPFLNDVRERVKIVNQTTGSTFDVTVYLCPYPIEELLHKASTSVDPSDIGVWDVDDWDGGKVYG